MMDGALHDDIHLWRTLSSQTRPKSEHSKNRHYQSSSREWSRSVLAPPRTAPETDANQALWSLGDAQSGV